MRFLYSNRETWIKKSNQSFLEIGGVMLTVVFSLYVHDRVEPFYMLASGFLFVLGIAKFIYYRKMPERVYVSLGKDHLKIRANWIDRNISVPFEEITRMQLVDGEILVLQTGKDREEEEIYLENMKKEDRETLLRELDGLSGKRVSMSFLHTNEEEGEERGACNRT
ncbi:hypothetical protein QRD89_11210 [Halobacillus sp. ACCC02827]|uniref:hypothetical protein n=1 Tax=Bacillaceae TaxID=186817 RepID=UPI0002A4E82E|nr:MULTISPECIES: hypothetical protein [Bacillaceae]ELK44901.1 hypothetical protein D479_17069 [Halobacillus sp. BAB-2008]QHT47067.1 hypothetical protein M662_11380 [Bacillus sp. SB49]WJE14294.1 hypothetical protein QRD89_11210 [Halobacillus sp. ACCC02827]